MSKRYTPPEVARALRVSRDKVRTWIENGELQAVNVASPGCLRPRYVVSEQALQAFEAARAVVARPKPSRRPKQTEAFTRYF